MRGYLRIQSMRAPYQRAGVEFGEERTKEIAIVDLDGARLLELIRDPVLKLSSWRGDTEGWKPIPAIDPGATADDMQLLIDVGREAGAMTIMVGEEPRSIDTVATLALREVEVADLRAQNDRLQDQLVASRAVQQQSDLESTEAQLIAAGLRDELAQRNVELSEALHAGAAAEADRKAAVEAAEAANARADDLAAQLATARAAQKNKPRPAQG